MYFIPRNNRLYSFIVHLSDWQRFLITLLLFLLILLVWYNLFLSFNFDKNEIIFLKKQKELFTKEYKKYHFLFENQLDINLDFLFEKINKEKIILNSYLLKDQIRKDLYSKKNVFFDLEGGFDQIFAFLIELDQSDYLIKYKEFLINKVNEDILNLKICFNVYSIKSKGTNIKNTRNPFVFRKNKAKIFLKGISDKKVFIKHKGEYFVAKPGDMLGEWCVLDIQYGKTEEFVLLKNKDGKVKKIFFKNE